MTTRNVYRHVPECLWGQTTPSQCEYRKEFYYCPHPEHVCTCPDWNITEEQAEAILREHGTNSREVMNGFVDRLLRERSEAINALVARNAEVKKALEQLSWREDVNGKCWCWTLPHQGFCLSLQALYAHVAAKGVERCH